MSIIQEIKESWGWTGINPVEVVAHNDFANLIIQDYEGKYWHLCPEGGYCEVIADNHDDLILRSSSQEFLDSWCMEALLAQVKVSLGTLLEGEKYYFAIGGTDGIPNIKIMPLVEIIRVSGCLAKQVRERGMSSSKPE